MRILLIRHGDPDYEHDTLTARGREEAQLLVPRLEKECIGDCYVSPLGRARDTAEPSLKALGKTAAVMDWLQEFPAKLDINGSDWLQRAYPDTRRGTDGRFAPRIVWDMLPGALTREPAFFDPEGWRRTEPALHSDLNEVYDRVTQGLDSLLAQYGCQRTGTHYTTEQGCAQTIAFFCHFGVSAVLLSHLMNVSPFVLWHSLCMAPTSVTEVVTEEREKGIVYFRALRIGDLSHLYAAGQAPSFSARFCEVFENADERH